MKRNSGEVLTGALVVIAICGLILSAPKIGGIFRKEAKKVEDKQEQVIEKKEQVNLAEKEIVKDAQENVRVAGYAIELESYDLAKDRIRTADNQLTVVTGGIEPAKDKELLGIAVNYTSLDPKIKAMAEKAILGMDQRHNEAINERNEALMKLKKAEDKLNDAVDDLQKGFAREQALADKYRALRSYFIVAVILTTVFLGYGLYTRFITVGGLFRRFGGALNEIEGTLESDKAKAVITALDTHLDEWHQKSIRKSR